jgi:hypothetical protein
MGLKFTINKKSYEKYARSLEIDIIDIPVRIKAAMHFH